VSEEFGNYRSMLDEVQRRAAPHNEPMGQLEGVVTAVDLAVVEAGMREGMDLLLMRFDELHVRVLAMGERLQQLEAALGTD